MEVHTKSVQIHGHSILNLFPNFWISEYCCNNCAWNVGISSKKWILFSYRGSWFPIFIGWQSNEIHTMLTKKT